MMGSWGHTRRLLSTVLLLLSAVLFCSISTAGAAEGELKVTLKNNLLAGRVGEPIDIGLILQPEILPGGFLYSVIAEVLEQPEGPPCEVVSGVPSIRATCVQEGSYRLRVKVSLLQKSSCGGASAVPLLDETVMLAVSP